jgi:obg-like ATPase 1
MQVVRCFDDDNVVHVAGKVDPAEDTDVINFELALADVAQIEKRLERLGKGRAKSAEEKEREAVEKEALDIIMDGLEKGKAARAAQLTAEQKDAVRQLQLLTIKPQIYAANVSEDEFSDPSANVHVQVCLTVCRTCTVMLLRRD